MSKEDGAKAGIGDPAGYFRSGNGKANLAPPDKAQWFRLVSVPLGNGDPNDPHDPGDYVAVAEPWQWPHAFANATTADLLKVQKAIDAGSFRFDHQAGNWAGIAVAEILKLNVDDPKDKAKIQTLIATWITTGALKKIEDKDENRRKRPFVKVGQWATN